MEPSGPEQPQRRIEGATAAHEDIGGVNSLAAHISSGATRPTPDLSGIFKKVTVANEEHPLQQPPSTPSPGVIAVQRSITAEMFPIAGPLTSSGDGGFTQAFEALKQDGDAPKQEPFWGSYGHNAAKGGEGEFTRLYQRADVGRSGPMRENQILPQEHEVRPFTQEVGGGFTQLLRTLSSEADAALPPSAARPPVQPAVEGPGEFTQIVSRSTLREAGNRLEKETVPEGSARSQSEAGEPAQAPHGPAGNLQLPQPMGGSVVAAGLQVGRHVATPGSVMPVNLPLGLPREISPGTPMAGRLQQYVPLLLIANLFAMVLLVLLAGFALLRHY